MMRLPEKISGYRSDTINEIIDYLSAITPVDSWNIHYDRMPSGIRPVFRESVAYDSGYKTLFEIYDNVADKCKIRGITGNGNVWVAGVKTATTAGTGGKKLDEEITFTANSYVFLKVKLGASIEVTLNIDSTIPDGDEDEEIYPLWYLPWLSDSSIVDWGNAVDMRHSIHVTAMAT